jgi:hypothetical protein
MKFKPTVLKTFISIISGFLGMWVVGMIGMSFFLTEGPTSTDFSYAKLWAIPLTIILVYIIWSLIQKK